MSIVNLARPEIQALRPYEAAEQVDDTVRLNANESPQAGLPGRFRRPLNRYPEVRPRRLQATLAERFGCRSDELLVTRGSSEAIDLITRTFCRPGVDSVLAPTPSFSLYRHYARVQGALVIEVASTAAADFRIDVEELLAACRSDTRLIFVCSPNNPTGQLLPREDLEALLKGRRDRSAVVIDEAYIEFAGVASAVELIEQYPNLMVLRTLSKALGFAGARCGAVIAQAPVIRLLDAVQAPYAIATPVIECVEDALKEKRGNDDIVSGVISERERLAETLRRYDFVSRVWPSSANFLLVEVDDAQAVMEACAANGVLLRHFGGMLSGCIRISVGSETENDCLLKALDGFRENARG